MIKRGSSIKLLRNRTYKDEPEKNEDFMLGEVEGIGKFIQFQTCDKTPRADKSRPWLGFFYVQIYTSLSLKVGDFVTVKDILYATRKNNIAIIGITIEETNPNEVTIDESGNELDYGY